MAKKNEGRPPRVGLDVPEGVRHFATKRDREILAAIDETGNAVAAAAKLGMAHQNVYRALNSLRTRAERAGWREEGDAPVRPGEKRAEGGRVVPLSEDERKFHEQWGPAECIAELRRIAEIDPDKVISRNYFRVHSDISESTWNRYFGTFHEFKRQAGIVLSRHAHRLERAIAKHASVDILEGFNREKRSYAGRWLKPGGKHQTILVASDIHDEECDPFFRRLFIEAARRIQPDRIVLDGDIYDLPEFGKYGVDPREWNPVRRIRWVLAFIADLRAAAPNAQIDFVEGNHEYRLLRHLSEATPALKVVLSDLHGMTIPKLLGLDAYEVNYIAPADLRAFTERDISREISQNFILIEDALLGHHFPKGREMGVPGWNGHHHRHLVWTQYSPTFGAFEWHQLGCGHKRRASYTDGRFWTNGFLIAHLNTATKRSTFEYVEIGDHAVLGGEFYERRPDEWPGAETHVHRKEQPDA